MTHICGFLSPLLSHFVTQGPNPKEKHPPARICDNNSVIHGLSLILGKAHVFPPSFRRGQSLCFIVIMRMDYPHAWENIGMIEEAGCQARNLSKRWVLRPMSYLSR
jgi:hypothetical protein